MFLSMLCAVYVYELISYLCYYEVITSSIHWEKLVDTYVIHLLYAVITSGIHLLYTIDTSSIHLVYPTNTSGIHLFYFIYCNCYIWYTHDIHMVYTRVMLLIYSWSKLVPLRWVYTGVNYMMYTCVYCMYIFNIRLLYRWCIMKFLHGVLVS